MIIIVIVIVIIIANYKINCDNNNKSNNDNVKEEDIAAIEQDNDNDATRSLQICWKKPKDISSYWTLEVDRVSEYANDTMESFGKRG